VYAPAARLGTLSFSGFIKTLSSVATKPQLRSLKVCKVHGSAPRARKMSTSLVAKVQSTVAAREPAAVVMNTMGATVLRPIGPLPCEMTLVTAAGGGGVGVGGVTTLSPQPERPTAIVAMTRHGRTARPPPYCFRALISLSPSEGGCAMRMSPVPVP